VTVYCATSNPGKLREFQLAAKSPAATGAHEEAHREERSRASLGGGAQEAAPEIDVRALTVPVPPPEEDGTTFEENAILKAEYYGRFTSGYLFADDSGLEVEALGGAPGVQSARYAGPEAGDEENNALLLDRLQGVTNRTARFVCVIALVHGGKLVKTFRGSVEGRILDGPRGAGGFGYDPLFYHPPFGCTFGEAPIEDKMRVSHRAQALEAMFAYLRSHSPD
jgi:XTP/dITP diphosphohydrolase